MGSRPYEISMVRSENIKEYVPTGAYKFDRGCGWVWLQSLCFWALDRIGCVYERQEVVDVERRVIDPEKFGERLRRAHEEIWRLCYSPTRIYIGSEDYADLMSESPPGGRLDFHIEYMTRGTMYNLPVQVIPWMRGILVV